jgi:hypothetical protein
MRGDLATRILMWTWLAFGAYAIIKGYRTDGLICFAISAIFATRSPR